jgi:hypothetical protein
MIVLCSDGVAWEKDRGTCLVKSVLKRFQYRFRIKMVTNIIVGASKRL